MCIHESLKWVRDAKRYLEDFSDPILSDRENCDYFRQRVRRKKVAEVPVVVKREVLPPPPVVLAPPPPKVEAPVVKEEPPPKKREFNHSLRSVFAKVAPGCPILDEIPSDEVAKRIANRWKTKNQIAKVTLVSYQEQADHRLLLEQIVKAIDVYFGPATLVSAERVEETKDWKTFLAAEELQLVIICDHTLWQLQNLRTFYRETPAQNIRLLGDKPLFMLPDLSLYLKDPLLKRSLWKALCQMISSLPSPSTKN